MTFAVSFNGVSVSLFLKNKETILKTMFFYFGVLDIISDFDGL